MKNIFLALALFLTACSQNDSKPPLAPVDNINSKISSNATNAMTGQAAIFEASHKKGKRRGDQSPLFNTLFGRSANIHQQMLAEKISIVEDSMADAACRVSVVSGQNPNPGSQTPNLPTMKVSVTGAGCAIHINLDISIEGDPNQMCTGADPNFKCKVVGHVKMSYVVRDEVLKQELQVAAGTIDMTIAMDQTVTVLQQPEKALRQVIIGSATIEMQAMDLQGQHQGVNGTQNINLDMMTKGSGNQMSIHVNGGLKENLTYTESATNTKSVLSADIAFTDNASQENYVIDGILVTRRVYMNERSKFSNSLMAMGSQESSPTPVQNEESKPEYQTGTHRWACLGKKINSDDYFIGYGVTESTAREDVMRSCQMSEPVTECILATTCEMQLMDMGAWQCQIKDQATAALHVSFGSSRIEAQYYTQRYCLNSTGGNSSVCNFANMTCSKK